MNAETGPQMMMVRVGVAMVLLRWVHVVPTNFVGCEKY